MSPATRVLTALAVVLGLAALPAAAQTTTVTIPTDATTSTGTVVAVHDDYVVFETADGVRHDLYWVDGVTDRDLLVADRDVTVTFSTVDGETRLYRVVTPQPVDVEVDEESRLEQNVEEFVEDVDEEIDSALDSIDEEADETSRDIGQAFDDAGDAVDDVDEELAGTDDELEAELPATGSRTPLVALIGLMLLGGAVVLRLRA